MSRTVGTRGAGDTAVTATPRHRKRLEQPVDPGGGLSEDGPHGACVDDNVPTGHRQHRCRRFAIPEGASGRYGQ